MFAHDNGQEGILKGLVRHLGHDIDPGQPAAVAGMRMIPPDDVLGSTDLHTYAHAHQYIIMSCIIATSLGPNARSGLSGLFARTPSLGTHLLRGLNVLNHILIRLISGIDPGLGALNGEGKGVHDDEGVAVDLALHEAHLCARDTRSAACLARPALTYNFVHTTGTGVHDLSSSHIRLSIKLHIMCNVSHTILTNAVADILTFLK